MFWRRSKSFLGNEKGSISGNTVVSTDCGGNREYAEDSITALLSSPGDPQALAENVIRLLEDDDLRIRLANAGYECIQKFTWERSTNLLEQFLKECE